MKNQQTILIAATSFLVLVLAWSLWPAAEDALDAPEVIAERLESSTTKEDKVEAARDLVRHGEAARPQIHAAFEQHTQEQPEVLAPLIQAVMKSGNYQSLPKLFKLMDHSDPLVRGRAGAAVKKLMGSDYGFRANMSPAQRSEVIARIRGQYEVLKGRFAEVYGH